jgi:predicted metal-dependent hydrolase
MPSRPPSRSPSTSPLNAPSQLALFDETQQPARKRVGDQRVVSISGQVLNYQLRRARRRTIGFVVDDRGLTVSAPRWVTLTDIEAGIREKGRWILAKLAEWEDRRDQMPRLRWHEGASMPLLGRMLRIVLDSSASSAFLREPVAVRSGGDDDHGAQLVLPLATDASESQIRDRAQGWLQSEARRVFAARLHACCERLGIPLGAWKLSSARTRWGSCTSDGTIRLNWRLLHLPLSAVDYVIAHELAHRREMNHGPRFWQAVESIFPEFRAAEALLKGDCAGILND